MPTPRLPKFVSTWPSVAIGDGEIGIERDRLLEERRGGFLALGGARLRSQAVGFQRFQRRGGGLFDRRVEFLNGGERFAELSANIFGCIAERAEDVIFVGGFGVWRWRAFRRMRS